MAYERVDKPSLFADSRGSVAAAAPRPLANLHVPPNDKGRRRPQWRPGPTSTQATRCSKGEGNGSRARRMARRQRLAHPSKAAAARCCTPHRLSACHTCRLLVPSVSAASSRSGKTPVAPPPGNQGRCGPQGGRSGARAGARGGQRCRPARAACERPPRPGGQRITHHTAQKPRFPLPNKNRATPPLVGKRPARTPGLPGARAPAPIEPAGVPNPMVEAYSRPTGRQRAPISRCVRRETSACRASRPAVAGGNGQSQSIKMIDIKIDPLDGTAPRRRIERWKAAPSDRARVQRCRRKISVFRPVRLSASKPPLCRQLWPPKLAPCKAALNNQSSPSSTSSLR